MPLTGEYGPSTSPWARQQVEDFYVAYGHGDWLASGLSDDDTAH